MRTNEYKKLLKNNTPKKLIYMHIASKINLTSKQLNEIIELKNK